MKSSSLSYLLSYLDRYRAKMVLGAVMVILTVATGMIAPWVLKYVVDDLQSAFSRQKLPQYAAMVVGISVAEGFFRFWMRKILIGVSREVEYDLRNDFLAHLQKMPLSFIQSRSTGDIMSRATNDLNAVRSVLGPGIMYSATTIVTVVAATAILLRINWQLTLLAYVPLGLASFTVKHFGQQIHDRFERIQEQFSTISTMVQENLSGIRVVKAFAREESQIEEFKSLNRDYVNRSVSLIRLWGVFYPLMSALIGLSSAALLWWGGRQVISGALEPGRIRRLHRVPCDADLAHDRRRVGDQHLPARLGVDGPDPERAADRAGDPRRAAAAARARVTPGRSRDPAPVFRIPRNRAVRSCATSM